MTVPDRTIGALLHRGQASLLVAGIPSPRLEARVLLGHVLGVEPARLVGAARDEVSEAAAKRWCDLVEARAKRVPLGQLVGSVEFWSMKFAVSRDVLSPRQDSETLIEMALAGLSDRGGVRRILDLGTGSGCLLLAAMAEFGMADGLGIDRSEPAIRIARANAEALLPGRSAWFVVGDWSTSLCGSAERVCWDLVLSNPPYIVDSEVLELEPEIAVHEPWMALQAGPDGLAAYRRIMPALPQLLTRPGIGVIELGQGQAQAVTSLAHRHGLRVLDLGCDLGGIERALVVARSE